MVMYVKIALSKGTGMEYAVTAGMYPYDIH